MGNHDGFHRPRPPEFAVPPPMLTRDHTLLACQVRSHDATHQEGIKSDGQQLKIIGRGKKVSSSGKNLEEDGKIKWRAKNGQCKNGFYASLIEGGI